MKKIADVSIAPSLSGMMTSPCGRWSLAVDAVEGTIYLLSVDGDTISVATKRRLSSRGNWYTQPFPFHELNGYFRANGFSCSFAPDSSLVAIATPETGLLILAIPDLEIRSSHYQVGQIQRMTWTADADVILVSWLQPTDDLSELIGVRNEILHRSGGQAIPGPQFLVGKTIRMAAPHCLATAADLQGESHLYFHEPFPPFRQYDLRGVYFTQPDVVSASHGRVASLEFDWKCQMSIFELTSCRWLQGFDFESFERPSHVHNMSAFLLMPDGQSAVLPGKDGKLLLVDLGTHAQSTVATGMGGMVAVGINHAGSAIITAHLSGHVALWQIPSEHRSLSVKGDSPFATKFIEGDDVTRTIRE